MNNDFDRLRNLYIGTVDYVSPSEIKVLLDTEAPQSTAINTGIPRLFPRINGFVLIPNEVGSIVGIITWLGVEHSSFPKRKGFKDFDLIDLPFPLRKMSINPVGTLKDYGTRDQPVYKLERGVYSFPSIGDLVILPIEEQLKSIVENKETNAVIKIGVSPIAGNAEVRINPDKLFGRHLAVLGNTGSGKSCSVAGLIRWSLVEAQKKKRQPNARFIILDPNGEYINSFNDLSKKIRKFKIKLGDESIKKINQLKVPSWMWNSEEWIVFSQAAPGVQKPMLLKAISGLRNGEIIDYRNLLLVSLINGNISHFKAVLSNLTKENVFPKINNLGFSILNLKEGLEKRLLELDQNQDLIDKINDLNKLLTSILNGRYSSRSDIQGKLIHSFLPFSQPQIENIIDSLNQIKNILSSTFDENILEKTVDTPSFFEVNELVNYLQVLSENEGQMEQFINTLSLRINYILRNEILKAVIDPDAPITLEEWLNLYIGENAAKNGQLSIIDLSLIPSEIIHVVIAVLSRLIFEATQRYKRHYQKELPTVLVLEEAHTFIKESRQNENTYSKLCRETFEKISREGRKFGLSLVLSSQRPSELSATVLSQCNTFLLHRIVNDRDQDLVRRLVPDTIGGLLKELPILPTQKAILLGWATSIPILVEMRELKEDHQPQSKDPKFWDVWTGLEKRKIDWKKIADDWQGIKTNDEDYNSNLEEEKNSNTEVDEGS